MSVALPIAQRLPPLPKRMGEHFVSMSSRSVGFDRYRFDSARYIREVLGWEPWDGTDAEPGQVQVLRAYDLAMRQQHERAAVEAGTLAVEDCRVWQPGQTIQNRLRIAAGYNIGKTKIASGITNHFFDCFTPSIMYTFAPGWRQIHDLLWKEIKTDRAGKNLPGRILDLELNAGHNHFVKGRATDNTQGTGTERVQGQHGKYLGFVLDEAEGIPDYVWDAVDGMASGGMAIVLMLANPRTQTSYFHKSKSRPDTASFRISSTWHPNVLENRDVMPGAVRREYVDTVIDTHCKQLAAHDPDQQTFTVPWRDGIFAPDAYAMFRVLGEAPANIADNVLIPVGRYQAATERAAPEDYPQLARIGVDVARYGKDFGTAYVRHNGRAWCLNRYAQQDTDAYARDLIRAALSLREQGCISLHIRIDGGGGFGGGVIDKLVHHAELLEAWQGYDLQVLEVLFNARPYSDTQYMDLATELYATTAEVLHRIRVDNPPAELEADLTERTYLWLNRQGHDVKKLEAKDVFKKRIGRSPDDGDGFALAVCPDYVFTVSPNRVPQLWVDDADMYSISPV